MRRLVTSALALTAALILAASAQAADIPVTTNADVIADDGLCSLREAILAAPFNMPVQGCPTGDATGADTLRLGAASHVLALPGTLEDGNMTGDLDTGPAHAMRIVGQGAQATTIDAKGLDRALDVLPTATLTIEDLTIRGGVAPSGDPGGDGGGVRNQGSLTVNRVRFDVNAAGAGTAGTNDAPDRQDGKRGGGGGAIWSGGALSPTLSVTDATFSGNRGGRGGEGIVNAILQIGAGGVGGGGGAIHLAAGSAVIARALFVDNRAGDGGLGAPVPGVAPPAGSEARAGRSQSMEGRRAWRTAPSTPTGPAIRVWAPSRRPRSAGAVAPREHRAAR